jgi:hypothetical protein
MVNGRVGTLPYQFDTREAGYGRYDVVRYPLYYAVVDLSTSEHDIVFETRDREKAHREAGRLATANSRRLDDTEERR